MSWFFSKCMLSAKDTHNNVIGPIRVVVNYNANTCYKEAVQMFLYLMFAFMVFVIMFNQIYLYRRRIRVRKMLILAIFFIVDV